MKNVKEFDRYLETHTLEETFLEACETFNGRELLCQYFLEVHQDWEDAVSELNAIKHPLPKIVKGGIPW